MLTTTYDASGNQVTCCCTRCGQSIRNVTYFRGLPYGPECIKAATGEPLDKWVVRDGAIDELATAEREARRAAERAERERAAAALAAAQAENAARFAWLADALRPALAPNSLQQDTDGRWYAAGSYGAFVASAVADLLNGSDPREWSQRRLDVVIDIVAKLSGRRGSKAYNAASDALGARLE